MINSMLTVLMNILATLIQIVCWPINQILVNSLPDLTDKLIQINNGWAEIFGNINWALGLLPTGILGVLTFIISVEIVKHTVFISTHTLAKVWTVLQKIKFW